MQNGILFVNSNDSSHSEIRKYDSLFRANDEKPLNFEIICLVTCPELATKNMWKTSKNDILKI